MRQDLADVLRNPFRFAAEKGRHMWASPRSIPQKALDYAKYDMVRAMNQVLDISGCARRCSSGCSRARSRCRRAGSCG